MKLINYCALAACTLILLATGSNLMAEDSNNPRVTLETTKGNIVIELYPDKAPKTVENFLTYVKDGHYDDTIFHRVIPGFMIQGGGMGYDMKEKSTRAPIPIESNNGLKNAMGTVAMARTNDPNSATSQFFINVADNEFLNFTAETSRGYGYAVFGKVIDGMDAVHEIEKQKTKVYGPHQDVPIDHMFIVKATINE